MLSIEKWIEALWVRTSAIQRGPNQVHSTKLSLCTSNRSLGKARDNAQSGLEDDIPQENKTRGPLYITILTDLGTPSPDLIVRDNTMEGLCLCIYADSLKTTTYPFLEKDCTATTLHKLYTPQAVRSAGVLPLGKLTFVSESCRVSTPSSRYVSTEQLPIQQVYQIVACTIQVLEKSPSEPEPRC